MPDNSTRIDLVRSFGPLAKSVDIGMNGPVSVDYSGDAPTVSGRDLHAALQIGTKYADWFKRMCGYGFIEGIDFTTCFSNLGSEMHGGQNKVDHQLTINMAKELCMIQRSDIGRQVRQYFLQVEAAWNSPKALMVRALQVANNQLALLTQQNAELTSTVAVQNQQIAEMRPKASYYDLVLNCKDLISTSAIAKDYGKSAVWMNRWLHEKGIQFKQGDIWILYQKYADKGYTSTKTHSYCGTDGKQHTRVHTYWTQKGRLFIYELMKADGILPLIEQTDEGGGDDA